MSTYNPFYDEVKERNAMKSGAFHKKNGSKSKKCTLPSDNLTPAQRKKLNGPVRGWNVKKPMSWDDFKKMPIDLQNEHIAFLQETFPGLSMAAISSRVFGQFVTTVRNYALRHGVNFQSGKGGPRISEETLAALEKWLSGGSEPVTEESTEAVVVDAPVAETRDPEPEPAPATKKPAEKFVVETLSAHISGTADDLLFYISAMLAGRSADVRIEMNFRKEEE